MKQQGSAWSMAIFGVIGFVLAGAVASLVIITVVPAEVKLVAPLFCSDDFGDAFVVSDETRVIPGQVSINYSLHCVGERGEVDEIGFLGPFLVLTVIHAVIIFIGVMLWGIRPALRQAKAEVREERRAKRSESASPADDDFVDSSTAGPFVD